MTSMSADKKSIVIMLCTASKGGMKSVVDGYQRDGLFAKHNIQLVVTHCEGGVGLRLMVALRALLHFINLLLTGRVVLVHAHVAMRGSFWRKCLFAMVARRFGVPVIGHIHGSEMKEFIASQRTFGRWLIRNQLTAFTRLIALSQSWAEYLQSVAPKARIVVIPNYVHVSQNQRVYQENRPVRLLFLGLVGDRKGIFDLLEAVAKINCNEPLVRLSIGGNGELDRCNQLIESLGLLSAAQLLGWVAGEVKAELLSASDVFVLPSYNEGLPVSILEAMAMGLPVVSSRVGGIPDLVRDEVDGVLHAPGDIDGLSDAISRLARSVSLRQRMGESGRARVVNGYSDQAVLPMVDRLYGEIALTAK